jgi:hypothetical protein
VTQPGITKDACGNCLWPPAEHGAYGRCPDYSTSDGWHGWANTVYRPRQLTLTVDTAAHMLADIDQIITEMEMNPEQRTLNHWTEMLRRAVDGEDYKR